MSTQKTPKRPTGDALRGMLLEGDFGNSTANALPISDPISTTQMVLKLAEIKPYDKNPRRERNPAYDDIKASIRSKKKLNNNFNVTRRPGDEFFMVESGGNTRLAILNELYLETADEVFNSIHCLFVPWQSEASILTAHLIENELRGDMILIDKAYAVQELKQELEQEQDTVLSDSAFTKLASGSGYKLSRRHLSRFNYAIKLDQMIPQVLRSGIGGNKLDNIKKVEKAYQQVCVDRPEQFNAAFMDVMSENDTPELFDFDQVRNELDLQLEKITGIRRNILYMKVTQIIEGQQNQRPEEVEQDGSGNPSLNEMGEVDQINTEQPIASNTINTPRHTDFNEIQVGSTETVDEDQEAIDFILNEPTDTSENKLSKRSDNKPLTPTETDPAVTLKRLRERSYDMACKIAHPTGLDTCVMQAQFGLGFFMETPPHQLTLVKHQNSYFRWWILYLLSEQAMSSSHIQTWDYSGLYKRLMDQSNNTENHNEKLEDYLGSEIGLTLLIHNGLQDKNEISDQLFTDIFRLMENARKIKQTFSDTELWKIQQ